MENQLLVAWIPVNSRLHKAAFTSSTVVLLLGMGDGLFWHENAWNQARNVIPCEEGAEKAELKGELMLVSVNESYTTKVRIIEANTNELPSNRWDLPLGLLNVSYKQRTKQRARWWLLASLVLVYKDCNTVWNRDVNAFNTIFLLVFRGNRSALSPFYFLPYQSSTLDDGIKPINVYRYSHYHWYAAHTEIFFVFATPLYCNSARLYPGNVLHFCCMLLSSPSLFPLPSCASL